MNRSILIIQPDKYASNELSRILYQWGDEVQTVSSLKEASRQLHLALPDLILIDVVLLGSKWPKSTPLLLEKFQRTKVIFTYYSKAGLPKSNLSDLVKWNVLTNPLTPERFTLTLEDKITDIEILEPLQKKSLLPSQKDT